MVSAELSMKRFYNLNGAWTVNPNCSPQINVSTMAMYTAKARPGTMVVIIPVSAQTLNMECTLVKKSKSLFVSVHRHSPWNVHL